MSAISGYTLEEAQEMLATWKACEQALASGQAECFLSFWGYINCYSFLIAYMMDYPLPVS